MLLAIFSPFLFFELFNLPKIKWTKSEEKRNFRVGRLWALSWTRLALKKVMASPLLSPSPQSQTRWGAPAWLYFLTSFYALANVDIIKGNIWSKKWMLHWKTFFKLHIQLTSHSSSFIIIPRSGISYSYHSLPSIVDKHGCGRLAGLLAPPT